MDKKTWILVFILLMILVIGAIVYFCLNISPWSIPERMMCGPAALEFVCKEFGIDASQRELARLAKTDREGTSMYGLVQTAKAKGLKAIGVRLTFDQLKKVNGYAVVHIKNNHFYAIKNIQENRVIVVDQSGEHTISLQEFQKRWDESALIIQKP